MKRGVSSTRFALCAGALALLGGAIIGSGGASTTVVPGRTIRSADGLFAVSIPRGALRRNVRISIRVLPKRQWPREIRKDRAPAATKLYRVLPEGLRFSKPVTVTRRLPGLDVSDGMPVAWFASRSARGRWSPLRNVTVRQDGRAVLVSGTTTHFSDFAYLPGEGSIAIRPRQVTKFVGERWDAEARPSDNARVNLLRIVDRFASGAVVSEAEPQPYRCARAGTGTYGMRVYTENGTIAQMFHFVLPIDQVRATTTLIGTAECRQPVTPPPPPPACTAGPAVVPTTYNAEPHIHVTGQCSGAVAAGADRTQVDSLSGKAFWALHAHSTGCSPLGTVTLTCNLKPDGRICMILKTDPPATVGDQFRVQIKKANGEAVVDVTLTVGANGEAACSVGP